MPAGRRLRGHRGPYTPRWSLLAVAAGRRYRWVPFVLRGRVGVRAMNAAEYAARRAAFSAWLASVVREHPNVPDPVPGCPGFADLAERAMRLRALYATRAAGGNP